MSYKCGDCLLFNGANEECGGGNRGKVATSTACSNSFKGAASLFSGKKCGGCRLFNGSHEKCDGGMAGKVSTSTACSNSYSPIRG